MLLILHTLLFYGIQAQTLSLQPGDVQGFEYTTKNGDIAEVFLNIPYAAPPVGELRFEKPSPPIPWKGIRNGTAFGATCHPHAYQAALQPPPNEDCLTLNIIRPKKEAPEKGFPILVWVHGGGYEIGSASLYGYKGFADIYIPDDIVVVTIQYRVGVYGFFSTGDSRIPGNLGLFDMAAAFKLSNANFGGDRSRITAWGLSAGGSAVGQLALSPITRDYIAGSIEMSGSPWAYWALGSAVANDSLKLAETSIVAKTVNASLHGYTKDGLGCIKWGPVIDGEFLQHPDEMTITAPPKPSIVGVSNKDASFFTIKGLSPYIHKFGVKPEDFRKFDRNKLIQTLEKLIGNYYKNYTASVLEELIKYYVERDEEHSYEFYLDRYTEFMSDVLLNVASVDGILARRKAGWKMYAYSFDHYNDAIWNSDVPERLRGSPHVNEYPYIFGLFILGNFEMGEKEQIVADVIQQSFINFVKSG
ncbi:unnamed protein product [Cylicocyclus nassatus]|uniref:Carboxylesterase type B domain-containing protein n=1 Tax=Cylicocyclus nassatus TaxID=53992 RepID=A0AA36GEC6_CYLNA|nr:unnamed protein product [Cylicocyclus nassatus]